MQREKYQVIITILIFKLSNTNLKHKYIYTNNYLYHYLIIIHISALELFKPENEGGFQSVSIF
jgi:hypothetical protein